MRVHASVQRLSLPPALLLALAGAPSALDAQRQPAALTVTVRAEGGRPLPGAQVLIQGMGIGGLTDARGVARLEGLPPGGRTVSARYLGFAPAEVIVTLEGGRSSAVAFHLVPRPIELAEVTVRGRASTLGRNGFMARRAGGAGGTFITRQEIAEMRPRYLSDVLRRVAGVRIQSSAAGGYTRAAMRGQRGSSGCPIQYYIDGTLTTLSNVDQVRPQDVEGLEIFRGAATVPPAYNQGTAVCGVMLIWTRVE